LFGHHRYCECGSYISNLNLIPNGKRYFYEVTHKIIYDILWILEAQGTNTTENADNIMGTWLINDAGYLVCNQLYYVLLHYEIGRVHINLQFEVWKWKKLVSLKMISREMRELRFTIYLTFVFFLTWTIESKVMC
jgi:hypothetical protein